MLDKFNRSYFLHLAEPWLYEREPSPNEIEHNAGRINGTGGLARLQAGVAQGWIDWARRTSVSPLQYAAANYHQAREAEQCFLMFAQPDNLRKY